MFTHGLAVKSLRLLLLSLVIAAAPGLHALAQEPGAKVLFEQSYTLDVSPVASGAAATGDTVDVTIRVTGPETVVVGEAATLTVEAFAAGYDAPAPDQSWDIRSLHVGVVVADDTARLIRLPVQSILVNDAGSQTWQDALAADALETPWRPAGLFDFWQALSPEQDSAGLVGGLLGGSARGEAPLSDDTLQAFYEFESAYDLYDLPDYMDSGAAVGEVTAKRYEIPLSFGALTDVYVYASDLTVHNVTAQNAEVQASLAEAVIIPLNLDALYGVGSLPSGGALTFGQEVRGGLAAGANNRWTFEGEAGQAIGVTMRSTDFDSYLELIAPDEMAIAYDDDSGGNYDAQITGAVLPTTGTYTIVARSYDSAATGIYTLLLADQTGATREVALGELNEGNLQAGTRDRWTFQGEAGQAINVEMASTAFDSYLELYGPDNTLLASDDDSGGNYDARLSGVTLPATGTYSIVARSYSADAAGSYTLRVSEVVVTTQTIEVGATAQGTLVAGTRDRWMFEGEGGHAVTVEMSSADFDSYLELYGPDGTLITSDDDSGGDYDARLSGVILPGSGTYTIVARSYSPDAAGPYTLTLTEDTSTAQAIAVGQSAQGTLAPEARDRWMFEGTPNQIVTIDMVSTDFDTYLELYAPDGVLLMTDDDSGGDYNAQIRAFMLPSDGTYTIIARSFDSSAAGPYTIRLSDVGGSAQPIEFTVPVEGSLVAGAQDRWTFEGEAGVTITATMTSAAFDAYLELYAPDGTLIASDDDSGGNYDAKLSDVVLPSSGTYTLVARSFSSDAQGAYMLFVAEGQPTTSAA